MIGAFLGTTLGKYVLIGVVVAGGAVALYLYIYGKGEAAAAAAAATAALERAAAAARAKAAVKHSKEEVDRDPYNLDRRP